MTRPVFVIHGIAMRSEERVREMVSRMNEQVGEAYRFIPVYWGDLGPSAEHLDKLIGRYRDRSPHAGAMMVDALAGALASGIGRTMSWVTERRGDAEAALEVRQSYRRARQALQSRARGYMNDKFQDARLWLTGVLLPVIADVIVYQSPTYHERIQQRILDVIASESKAAQAAADEPLTIIGHSLGGVIAFDLAVRADAPLRIDQFITVGSQPSFFHVMDPRPGVLPAYAGEPITLPTTLGRWTNIWDEFDVLAFGASEVFRLHDGSEPVDVPIRCWYTAMEGAVFMQSHVGYWDRKPATDAVRRALSQPAL